MAELPAEVDLREYDFLDFGSSLGASTDFARRCLGGTRGLGIDFDPKKVAEAVRAGRDCIVGNIAQMNLPGDAVSFVIINHVLEHLQSTEAVRTVLERAAHVARDFVYVGGPWFDADEYLKGLGLKFYWSDWQGHRTHVTTGLLSAVLDGLNVQDYVIMGRDRIEVSNDSSLLPLNAEPEQHHYSEETHGYKTSLQSFSRPVFKQMACVITLRDCPNCERALKFHDDLVRVSDLQDEHHEPGDLYSLADIEADLVDLERVKEGIIRSAEIKCRNQKWISALKKSFAFRIVRLAYRVARKLLRLLTGSA
jgi:hypothetical protein